MEELITLTASDATQGDLFGISVAINGNYAIIGAVNEGGDESYAGAAYIFFNNENGWTETQKITASDRSDYDFFGYSVAIDGDYAIVGAYGDDGGRGSAYIFRNNAGIWTQVQKITAPDRSSNDLFGYSLAIYGDYAFVGAPDEDHNASGGSQKSNAGSIYVFHNSGSTWTYAQKLVAFDRNAYNNFGKSVAVNSNVAIIGSPREDRGGINDHGSAYFFHNINGNWDFQQKIYAPETYKRRFGAYVDIVDNRAVVGIGGATYDSTYVDFFSSNGTSWELSASFSIPETSTSEYTNSGIPVSIDGDFIVAGTYGHDHGEIYAGGYVDEGGEAFIFSQTNGTWDGGQKLAAPAPRAGEHFGRSVAVDNGYVLVGTHYEEDNGSYDDPLGRVVVYRRKALITSEPSTTTICAGTAIFQIDGTNIDFYQWQLSVDGGTNWTNLADSGP